MNKPSDVSHSLHNKPEIYVSTDVEADGPIPGVNSMLSFGSAAYLADKTLVSTFTANLETLPGAVADPKTMEWWKRQPEAWETCHENLQPPHKAMADYLAWLKALPGTPVFVGYPAAYDFLARHQNACDGSLEKRIPENGQAKYA